MAFSDATTLQLRRGDDAAVSAFTGSDGEVIVNLTNHRLHVQDGVTAGGVPVALQSEIPDVSETISVSGDVSGTITPANNTTELTLADSGVPAGTYNSVTVNSKGIITNAENKEIYTKSEIDTKSVTLSGDENGNLDGTLSFTNPSLTLHDSGVTAGTYNSVTVNSKGIVTAAENKEIYTKSETYTKTEVDQLISDNKSSGYVDITVTGTDAGTVTGTINNDASSLALADSGVPAGTYNSVTVNSKGVVTAAENKEIYTKSETYTRAEINSAISTAVAAVETVDTSNYYTKNEVYAKTETYSKTEVDGLIPTVPTIPTVAETITVSGDVSGTITPANSTAELTLASSGVTAGTYNSVTVNEKGIVTAASNVASSGTTTSSSKTWAWYTTDDNMVRYYATTKDITFTITNGSIVVTVPEGEMYKKFMVNMPSSLMSGINYVNINFDSTNVFTKDGLSVEEDDDTGDITFSERIFTLPFVLVYAPSARSSTPTVAVYKNPAVQQLADNKIVVTAASANTDEPVLISLTLDWLI